MARKVERIKVDVGCGVELTKKQYAFYSTLSSEGVVSMDVLCERLSVTANNLRVVKASVQRALSPYCRIVATSDGYKLVRGLDEGM